ncbi:unnamed protein product [Caenorhabditis auriculariae]|uniref:Receptor L-domain domain-containing protein n=1 Tax=Caenorhabditis auriculariae TaxID=2777116 RepID=A0A8S1HH66_9PELO|nr:unnamed protein product [Caenorhabditis auriculariae]
MVKLINAIFFFSSFASISLAQDACCQRLILSYPTGDAIPPGCNKLKCTDAPVHVEESLRTAQDVANFLNRAINISTLTVIKNNKPLEIFVVEQIFHSRRGPAVLLKDVDLHKDAFVNLKKIEVKDVSLYCEDQNIVVIEGKCPEDVKERLHKVAYEVLAKCAQLTPLGSDETTTQNADTNTDAEGNYAMETSSSSSQDMGDCESAKKAAKKDALENECVRPFDGLASYAVIFLAFMLILVFCCSYCLFESYRKALSKKKKTKPRHHINDDTSTQSSVMEVKKRKRGGLEGFSEVTTELDTTYPVLKHHVKSGEAPAQMYLSV